MKMKLYFVVLTDELKNEQPLKSDGDFLEVLISSAYENNRQL
jgi:hypothetical protein